MSYTFELGLAIDPNLRMNTSPGRSVSISSKFKEHLGADFEQICENNANILDYTPANLVGLAHEAFSNHRHMVLSPDAVWLTIERGLAIHITENAEELRPHFVDFKGKQTIGIRRDSFIRGGKNDWKECFDEFSEKIGDVIGKKKDLIVGSFSTTGTLERVSSEIVLMDAMSKYFSYLRKTLCSIPLVTLEGKVEDWESIRDRAQAFSEFGLSWWTDHLLPVLDQLVLTAKGQMDLDFWRSWYKENGGSGGPFINGYIQKFYPYLGRTIFTRNTFEYSRWGGITLDKFPLGFSKVPFVWNYYDTNLPMEFVGGIIGVSQNENGFIQNAFGWAVRDESVPLLSYPMERFTKGMVIHGKDGDRGVLERAEAEEWQDGSRELSEFTIKWEREGIKTHTKWDAREFFVKEISVGGGLFE